MKNIKEVLDNAKHQLDAIVENSDIVLQCPYCKQENSFKLNSGKAKEITCNSCKKDYLVYRFKKNNQILIMKKGVNNEKEIS